MASNFLSYSDINCLVMDYLITNGYPAAAKKFAAEANIQPIVDLDSIQERVAIRTAIHSGDIRIAIEKINELNPLVCFTVLFLAQPIIFTIIMIISVSCTTPKCHPREALRRKKTSSVLSMTVNTLCFCCVVHAYTLLRMPLTSCVDSR